MSKIFKLFILFGVFSTAFSFNVRDDAPWFKEQERITDRFLVGMIKGRNTFCNSTQSGIPVGGICVSSRECGNLGGIRGGACSFLGSCCIVEKTCSEVTSSKISYFVPPKVFQPDCRLTVKPMNRDVCQIRLDFERFTIARPTQLEEHYGSNKSFQCHHDAFTVTGAGNLGFVHLCGENTKQHIYIPVNNNNVVLRFQLTPNRNNGTFLAPNPEWRIKIHQLECTRLHSFDINNVESNLFNMHQNHQNHQHHHHHHHHHKHPNNDYHLIAPTGCLQYYPQTTGVYESFNFNQGHGPYIGMTKYAICFRRTPDICGISHVAEFFLMNYNVNEDYSDFRRECHPNRPASEEISQDSLQIPGGKINNEVYEYFCNSDLDNTTRVISTVPGPLYVVVRTDAFQPRDRLELGFRMRYQLLASGCDLQP